MQLLPNLPLQCTAKTALTLHNPLIYWWGLACGSLYEFNVRLNFMSMSSENNRGSDLRTKNIWFLISIAVTTITFHIRSNVITVHIS